MKTRYLSGSLRELCFSDHKIAFVSGPRQCGKTTLAKMLLKTRSNGEYKNWDDVEFRRIWTRQPSSIIPPPGGKIIPLIVLDEIHKDPRWKRRIKGIYDTLQSPCDILVTGSARLNVYKKGSDSLLGRYFHFRLHPFSLREMEHPNSIAPDELIGAIFSRSITVRKKYQNNLEAMMKFGPFPEPLFAQNTRKAKLWQQNRTELTVREDLRDISRIPELSRVEMMVSLLPERIGSPFSVAAIREDLEVSFDTVRRWMAYLTELYYLFELKPYSKRIARSLKRERKIYLWDYSCINDNSVRFENLIATHLLKACDFWTDTGLGVFELFYLRNKEKEEIDFLIVKDGTPWLPIEVKYQDTEPSPNWKKFAKLLPCKRGIQIVSKPTWKLHSFGDTEILVAGADEILNYFV